MPSGMRVTFFTPLLFAAAMVVGGSFVPPAATVAGGGFASPASAHGFRSGHVGWHGGCHFTGLRGFHCGPHVGWHTGHGHFGFRPAVFGFRPMHFGVHSGCHRGHCGTHVGWHRH